MLDKSISRYKIINLISLFLSVLVIFLMSCTPPGESEPTKVAKPVFSPAPGTIEQATDVIIITCATSGATIHYTMDGSPATDESPTYAGAINASTLAEGSVSINAIAVKDGITDSDPTAAVYTIVDTLAPFVSSVIPATGDYATSFPVTIQINWSEDVNGFASGDITNLVNCSLQNWAQVTQSRYTFDLVPATEGVFGFQIGSDVCTDNKGYSSTGTTDWEKTYDSTLLLVTINQAGTQADPTNSSTINFTVVFSESVSDFADGDVTISGTSGGTKTCTVTEIAPNDGTTYNAAVSGMTGDGTVIANIAVDAAHNGAGDGNQASTSTDNTVTYVTISDVPSGLYLAAADDSGLSNSDTITNQTSALTIGGLVQAGSSVALSSDQDGALGSTTANGGGVWTLDVTLSANKVHSITAVGTDTLGNVSDPSAPLVITVDTIPPTVVGAPDLDAASDSGSSSADNNTNITNPSFTGTSTEAGTLNIISSVDGTRYTGAITGNYSGVTLTQALSAAGPTGTVHSITSQVTDTAGNIGNSSGLSVTVDTTAPVTINQAGGQADPTSTSPINFDVVFSESVTDFATGDVTISGTAGGTKTATVNGNGTTYTVAVTGMTSEGTVIADINAGMAHDAAGNASEVSTSIDKTVTWFNSVAIISGWFSSTTNTITNLTAVAGSNRILLVFATARRTNNTPSRVTSIAWGGQALTILSERTYNTTNPTVTNSIWYLKETGIAAATSPSNCVITWNGAPTTQQIWAVFLQNVDQTTSFANVQGGDSINTNVTSVLEVSNSVGDMGFFSVSSITTATGTYTINTSGFAAAVDSAVAAAFDAVVATRSYTADGSFTPSATRATSNKQTLQGFVIQGY